MTNERKPGHLWAIVQEWLDSMPYPPSQRKLAARLEVSPATVSDWKYGVNFPAPDHLRRLAAELGVPHERVLDAVLRDQGYRMDRDSGATTTERRRGA
jgi:transcriptional regulator with XRE-family HTH domain